MVDRAELDGLIGRAGPLAWEAWRYVRGSLPSEDGLRAAALKRNGRAEDLLADIIDASEVGESFALALQAKGIVSNAYTPPPEMDVNDAALASFIERSSAYRCLVLKNGAPAGSGVLVAPSLVLTAWHVIAVDAPDKDQLPAPLIQTQLADGRTIEAVFPARQHSFCTAAEWASAAPASDADCEGFADVALLALYEAAGLPFGYARLGDFASPWPGERRIILMQYPRGAYHGVDFGRTKKLRGLTARWGHNVDSAAGSSGGGCFDYRFLLAGIHQGRTTGRYQRMVPTYRFPAEILELIRAGEMFHGLWSLDGTPDSSLIIGRKQLFTGFEAIAGGKAPRLRGLWLKRVDWRTPDGLGFSFRILQQLVARTPGGRIVRVIFDTLISDHVAEIARRASEAGLEVEAPVAVAGAADGETQPEAVTAARARTLAEAIDGAARRVGATVWLYLQHPSVTLGEEPRWAVAAFVAAALKLETLRIVLGGYEATQMEGELFQDEARAQGPGGPGLLVEYMKGFTRQDVSNVLAIACAALGEQAGTQRLEDWTEEALSNLPVQHDGAYAAAQGEEVTQRLRPRLVRLAGRVARSRRDLQAAATEQ